MENERTPQEVQEVVSKWAFDSNTHGGNTVAEMTDAFIVNAQATRIEEAEGIEAMAEHLNIMSMLEP